MRQRLIAVMICATAWLNGLGADVDDKLVATRGTLEKWVETKQLVSKARGDWQTDKETIEQTIGLFERELAAAEEQFAKLSTNSTQVEKERLQAETTLKSSNESLDRSQGFATTFEAQLTALVPKLPQPLQEILKPLLNKLPADPAQTKLKPTERIQTVIGILNEVDKFNNAVTIFSEKRKDPTGAEVAVQTVYVGLGSAYFVSDNGSFAGMGTPGASGWEWTPKLDIAASVKEVIRIYRAERTAQFVSLPAVIR